MIQLIGNVGLGHVRYPTAGASSNVQEAQPFVTNIPFGICLCHNGNITNSTELTQQLSARYTVSTDSDSELLLSIYADELLRQMWGGDKEGQSLDQSSAGLTVDVIFNACRGLMARARGGYAALVLINGYGVLAFRDPWGIRPLCYGSRNAKQFLGTSKKDWCVASESVALECQEFDLHGDVLPGQAVFISLKGEVTTKMCHSSPVLAPCIFEYVYFGRPDSIIDGVSVYAARKAMGDKLAEKIRRLYDPSEIDVVVPVPETSRISALQCAIKLGVPYEEGLNKNRYIARTFIMPGQQKRKKNVRKKLNPCHGVFEDKNVMLVDDSIVRGTTSEQIVQMVRSAGAKKVFFCSASPAIRYANVYGIDMPVQAELIAFGRDEKEIARAISADWVVYQVSIGGDYTWFLFTLRLSSRDIFQSKMVTVWALIQINNFFHSGTR
jgi:amidophosphoribosyltransferase